MLTFQFTRGGNLFKEKASREREKSRIYATPWHDELEAYDQRQKADPGTKGEGTLIAVGGQLAPFQFRDERLERLETTPRMIKKKNKKNRTSASLDNVNWRRSQIEGGKGGPSDGSSAMFTYPFDLENFMGSYLTIVWQSSGEEFCPGRGESKIGGDHTG